jgi:uncharacterized protein YndB with AHSA1/START domain
MKYIEIYLNDQPSNLEILMKLLVLALALTLTASAQSPTKPAPERVLRIELTIRASRAEVWQAFTTSDGLSTWLTPGAVADLRPGGEWTARFPGGSTGGGTILSFVPQQDLVISALAPDRFPTVRADRTTVRFHFESRGDSTLVSLTQTGWKTGKEWDAAYEYLASGNAQLLATLHRRFVNGPIDWAKEWGPAPAK